MKEGLKQGEEGSRDERMIEEGGRRRRRRRRRIKA